MPEVELIYPDWPAPAGVHALCTTRAGGVSSEPWTSLNLGDHVGDDKRDVVENRSLLMQKAALPSEPVWLKQVHGCVVSSSENADVQCEADARFADQTNHVCAVLTADCLPLLICNRAGTEVAAVHAGWRGLVDGVIEQAIRSFSSDASDLLVWLGPAISARAFEVGNEVREAFLHKDQLAETAFEQVDQSHWWCDLYLLARQRLQAAGVTSIYGGEFCTYHDAKHFYSYRRDGQTGRMASMIWFET